MSRYTLAVGSITVTASGVVYVGTGEPNTAGDALYGAGILKSDDGGKTWTQLGLSNFWRQRIFDVIVSPSNQNMILAAVTSGLWSSADGGTTWNDVGASLPGIPSGASFTSLALDPSKPSVVYAAGGGEIFKSTDFGVTWTPSTPTSTGGCFAKAGTCRRISLAIAASSPSTVLAAAQDGTLWRTTDSGATWSLVTSPHFGIPFPVTNFCNEAIGDQCDYDILVAVDPTDPKIIFLGGQDLWVTFDGGKTWADEGGYDGNSLVGGNIHSDQHALVFSPADHQKIFVGNDGGIWTSRWHPRTFGGQLFKWTDLNDGLSITQFYSVAADPQELSSFFGGTQDIGIVDHDARSSASHALSSTIWDDSNPGDGGWTSYDPSDPTTQYSGFSGYSGGACASDLFSAGTCLLRRDNRTPCFIFCFQLNGWFGVFPGSCSGLPQAAAIDPSTPTTLYYADPCSNILFKSTDRGDHWAPAGLDMATACGGKKCGASISAVAVGPSNGAFVYAGTSNGKIFVSTDGGASFTERDSLSGGGTLPGQNVTKIAVDPTDPMVAFATFDGFGVGHVWVSHDAGANWTDISSDLPDLPADSILVDPAGSGAIYVGTDSGVFVSLDAGATWQPFGTGLPRVQVADLEFSAGHVALVAATHGRGIWTISHLPMHPLTYVATLTQGLGLSAHSVEADCYPGDFATGGGFEITGGATAPLASEPNVTSGEPTGWVARFGVGTGGTAKVFADCMAPSSVAGTVTSTHAVQAVRVIPCTRLGPACIGSPAGGVKATCGSNEIATGGGFRTGGSKVVRQSRPDVASGTPTGWSAFFGISTDMASVTVRAFAICSPGPGFSTGVISATSSLGIKAGGLPVACPSGDGATGGGFSFTGGVNVPLRSEPDVPAGVASGWFTFFGIGTGGTATAFAVCMTGSTTLSVSCGPSSVLVGAQTTCTATVSNLDPTFSKTPSGPVAFSSSRPGSFSPAQSCALSGTGASSSCSVRFAPSTGSVGVVSITATYDGDANHLGSSESSPVKVFDFTVHATPTDRTVLRGSTAPYILRTTLVPGSAGAPAKVGLVVSGLPVDASSGPATLALPGTGTLTVQTGAVSLGDFAVAVHATVQGGARSVAIGLHVYDFTVTTTPGNLQILTTGSNTYLVKLLLVPRSSTKRLPPIALAASGLPTAATGSFNPVTGSPSFASTLTITTTKTPSGTYALTITGTDGRTPEGGTRTAHPTLTVLTPAQALQLVINTVNGLEADGVLNHGQANSLTMKLRHAISNLNQRPGKRTACNELSAFVHEVNAYIAASILTPAQAATLLDGPLGVLAIMAAIPC